MKKISTVLGILFALVSNSIYEANADNANPPKILSLTQITKGPYKPGDVITFNVQTSGGNPGLKYITIILRTNSGEIVNQYCDLRPQWTSNIKETNQYFGNGLVSAIVSGCSNGTYKVGTVTIKDLTDLTDTKDYLNSDNQDSNLLVQVDNGFKTILPGEIKPTPQPDYVELPNFPKPIFKGKTISYKFPKYSHGGQYIQWGLLTSDKNTCKTETVFPDTYLRITGKGRCSLFASIWNTSIKNGMSNYYSSPVVRSSWTNMKSNPSMIMATIK